MKRLVLALLLVPVPAFARPLPTPKPILIRGPEGPAGLRGPVGIQGPIGLTGLKGDPGINGEKGAKGDAGAPGQNGAKGDPGLAGAPGANGSKGDKGDTGSAGTAGLRGPQGPPGPAGPTGTNGVTLNTTVVSGTVRGLVGGGQAFTTNASFPVLTFYSASFPSPIGDKPQIVVKHNELLNKSCAGNLACYSDDDLANQDKCPGTADVPEAAPGYLCLYPVRMRNTSDVIGSVSVYGFQVRCGTMIGKASQDPQVEFLAVWAYTPQ